MSTSSMSLSSLQMQLLGGAGGGVAYCMYLGIPIGSATAMCAAVGAASAYGIGMANNSLAIGLPDPTNMLYAFGYGFVGSYAIAMSGIL